MSASVLVIGSGGREHAIALKLSESRHVGTVVVYPGNAGTKDNGKIVGAAGIFFNSTPALYCPIRQTP